MKKLLLILLFLFSFSVQSYSSTGAGVQFGYPGDVALTLKMNQFPVIGVSWNLGNNGYIGATLDGWLLNKGIKQTDLDWYWGVGGFLRLQNDVGVGARMPVGLQWFFHKQFELYGEIVPGLSIIPDLGIDVVAAIGLRYYFK